MILVGRRFIAIVVSALALWGSVCLAQTPTPIQHISSGRENNPLTVATVTLRNATQGSVALIAAVEHDMTSTPTVTITDDKGNTWTQNGGGSACTSVCAAAITSNGQGHWLFYATNVISGTQVITITFNGAANSPSISSIKVSEFFNVATVSPFRAFGTFTGTGAAAVTLSATAGDLVYEFGSDTAAEFPNVATITAGAGFKQLYADREAGTFGEYSTTATNGTFTHAGTDIWNAVAVALKPAAAGSAPASGIRVVKSEFHQFDSTSTVRQTPCTGNLLVANWTSPDVTLTITDSNSNTWLSAGTGTAANGLKNQTLYAANATCSDTMTMTATYSGASGGLNGMTFYDIIGAATSPFDNATTSNGNNATQGDVTSGSITPTTTNGLIINGLAVFWHSLTGCSVSAGTCVMTSVTNPLNNNDPTDGCTNIPGTAASTLWEDDGHAHVYNATTAAVTFTYPNTSSNTCTANKGVGNWSSVSAAFKAAATTGSPTRMLLGVGKDARE